MLRGSVVADVHDESFAGIPRRVLVGGVLAVVALVFLPTAFFGFVYDDHWTFLSNGFLRVPGDLWVLAGPEAVQRNVPDAFRPTLVLFDMAAYQLMGVHPLPHHLVSIGLYVSACFLVERWLAGLGAPLRLRIATVGVWGVMAIHAETVAVVSYREDLLAAGLGLGALVAADRFVAGRRWAWAWLGVAAFAMMLAAGAKLSAAPLPVAWWLGRRLSPWSAWPGRRGWIGAVALASGVGVVLLHRASLYGGDVSPYGAGTDPHLFATRVDTAAVWAASLQIHLQYLQQLVVPTGLSPEYVDFAARWSEPATVLAAGAFAGLLGYASWAAWSGRRPIAAFAILAAFALAIPTSNLLPMPNMRADRFMLLPSLPVALGLAAGLLALGRRFCAEGRLGPALAPLIAFVIVQGAMAQGAAASYRSDSRLWSIALQRAPHSSRAHAIAGQLLVARMHDDEALAADPLMRARASALCANAVRLDPFYDVAYLCRARLATLDRQWSRAHRDFAHALDLHPVRRDRVLAALASITLDLPDVPYPERVDRAFAHLDRALREYPYAPEIVAVAARLEHRLGRPERAAAHYRRASQLRPERWDLVLSGLELLLDLGHPSAAEQAWAESEDLIEQADPVRRTALRRRLSDARRLFTPSPFDDDPPNIAGLVPTESSQRVTHDP